MNDTRRCVDGRIWNCIDHISEISNGEIKQVSTNFQNTVLDNNFIKLIYKAKFLQHNGLKEDNFVITLSFHKD